MENVGFRPMANAMSVQMMPFDFLDVLMHMWQPRHGKRHGERHECEFLIFSPFFVVFVPFSHAAAPSWQISETNIV